MRPPRKTPREVFSLSREQDRGKNKLTSHEQMEVVKLIGWFWKDTEIADFVYETFNKTVNPHNFKQYRDAQKWKPIIEKFRSEYMKTVTEVPLANKKKRLEILQKLFDKHYQNEEFKDAREVVRECRYEMEEKPTDVSFHFTQVTNNEFKDLSDEEIAKRKLDAYDRLEKVKLITNQFKPKEILDGKVKENA